MAILDRTAEPIKTETVATALNNRGESTDETGQYATSCENGSARTCEDERSSRAENTGKSKDERSSRAENTGKSKDGRNNRVDSAGSTIHYELPACDEAKRLQILEHIGYTVGYNTEWLLPAWVAYELTQEETNGGEERTNKFLPDPLLGANAVTTKDYTNSGYDRGHMAPAGDMKWSQEAMRESFYMSNICPQVHSMNAGDWKDLENLVRDLAIEYGDVYVCCGPIIKGGEKTIGETRKIIVPTAFYKVLLRQKNAKEWVAIGFVLPNAAGSKPLMTYMLTVDEVEKMTGLDFFPNLPDDIENKAEGEYHPADWSVRRQK